MIALSEKELKANAEEYKNWRSKKLGASEVPAIMGVSPYDTPYGVWLKKTGRVKSEFFTNPVIELGNKFEATARSLFEMKTDLDFPPTIVVNKDHNFMHASLDGFNADHNAILEIKCVSGDKVFNDALNGVVVEHYYDQVQAQLMNADASVAYFFVCKLERVYDSHHIASSAVVIEKPNDSRQKEILNKCLEFWDCVQNDKPPTLMSRDVLEITDHDLVSVASNPKNYNSKELFKLELIKIVEAKGLHKNIMCCGWHLQSTKQGWRLTDKRNS